MISTDKRLASLGREAIGRIAYKIIAFRPKASWDKPASVLEAMDNM